MARLRLFAGVKDVAGVEEIEVDVSTVGGLVAEADGRFGADFIKARSGANLWLNGDTQIDDLATPIGRKDEVAIIPPVAGGSESGNGSKTQKSPKKSAKPTASHSTSKPRKSTSKSKSTTQSRKSSATSSSSTKRRAAKR